jgi:N-acyl-D-amino-acid deacylase
MTCRLETKMAKFLGSVLAPIGLTATLLATTAFAQAPERFDVIVRHGSVFDGAGGQRYAADVGIRDGYIAKVGDLSSATASKEIDAKGLFVAPGFINIHDHSTTQGIRHAANMLTQGVTLGVTNADGGGSVDLPKEAQEFSAQGMGMNLAFSIGFNSVWSQVMGPSDRRPTKDDTTRMQALIVKGLEDGAAGVAAGLDYKPAYFSTPNEAVDVLKAASAWRTYFPNHDRLAPPTFSSHQGMAETVDIASRARIMPEITHIKIQGHEQGSSPEILRMINDATAHGHYVAADIYPYLAGMTGVANLMIPGWAQDGGRPAMLKRFADPATRQRIATEAEEAMRARIGGPEGIYIPSLKREFTDIMREEGVGAGEALIRVLEKDNPLAVLRFGKEADMVALLKHDSTAIACDCGADDSTRGAHRRGSGTFPRILGVYVRDQHVLTWEDAVRKMSGLPANTVGLVDRGFIAPGMRADVTIFDPQTVRDHSTYEEPFAPSEGIRVVLVNGKVALEDGKPTSLQAGEVVRLTRHMPSRPMSTLGDRRLASSATFNGPAGKLTLSLDVRQAAANRQAAGRARVTVGKDVLNIERLGILQVSHKWASFTGWANMGGGRSQPVTVIVDAEAPDAPAGQVTLSIATPERTLEGHAPAAAVQMSDVAAYR